MFLNPKMIFVFLFTIGFMSTNYAQVQNKLEKNSINSDSTSQNPFLRVSQLPFQAPAFDQIHDYDYKPAMEEGMKQQMQEIR